MNIKEEFKLILADEPFKIVRYYDQRLDEQRYALIEEAEDGNHVIVDKPTGCGILHYLFSHYGTEPK